jgi:hypothetical protein
MEDARQTIWHQGYEKALKTITSLRNHSDFKYQKDTHNSRKVIILNADKPTVRKYTPGVTIKRDPTSVTKQEFEMDQMYYFNVGIDHVDKAQTVPGALLAICQEGAEALSEKGDEYVATLVANGVNDGKVEVVDATNVTKNTAIEKLEDAFVKLYQNNVPQATELYSENDPTYFSKIRQNLTELYTNNVEMAKKGIIGKYGNALITIENLLPKLDPTYKVTSDTDIIEGKTYFTRSGEANAYVYTEVTSPAKSSLSSYYEISGYGKVLNFLRTKKAVAFCEQIEKVVNYEVQDGFETAQKGLYVYGGILVRPKEVVCIKTSL